MNKVFPAIRKFLRDEEGVTAIEYGMIAAMIAVGVSVAVYAIGTQLNTLFLKIVDCLQNPKGPLCV
jgi:pilus assembly protein Flp/PilA